MRVNKTDFVGVVQAHHERKQPGEGVRSWIRNATNLRAGRAEIAQSCVDEKIAHFAKDEASEKDVEWID